MKHISPGMVVDMAEQASPLSKNTVVLRCVLSVLIVALATYGWNRRNAVPPQIASFVDGLEAAQRLGGPQYSAIVGDSITAAAPLPSVCGKPVVKAAFDGARVAELVAHVVPRLAATPPSAVLLAAGVNDTWRRIPMSREQRLTEFRTSYRTLIVRARALTPHVGIVLIPPVAREGALGATFFDTTLIEQFNGIIIELAAQSGLPTFTLAAMAGADGFTPAELTRDGVHPTDAGYAVWIKAVNEAWPRVKTCS